MKTLLRSAFLMIILSCFQSYSQSWLALTDSTKFYQANKDYQTGLGWALKALEQNEKEFGKDTNYIGSLGNVVDCFMNLNMIDSAFCYQEIQLILARKLYSRDSQVLSSSINNMALINEFKGNFSVAESLYRESLEIKRRIFKGDSSDLVLGIENLANLLLKEGKNKEAIPFFKELIEMRQRIKVGDDPALARNLLDLALALRRTANYTEAGPLFKASLEMRRRLFKVDNPELAKSINSMGTYLIAIGNFHEAEPLILEALEMRRRLFKGDHPELAEGLNNLATFYIMQGRYAEAEPLMIEALGMRRRIYKGDNPELANTLLNIAAFYDNQGIYRDAEAYYKEALEMNKRIFRGDDPAVAASLMTMAMFFELRGKYAEADPLYRESLAMLRRVIQSDHPYLASALSNYAIFLKDRGSFEDAEKMQLESLEMHRRLYKGDHPYLAAAINNMANVLKDEGNYEKAESLFKEALDMNRRLAKQDSPNLASAIFQLAFLYFDQEKYGLAGPLLAESLEMRRRIYKLDYPELSLSIHQMAFFYEETGQPDKAESLYKEALEMRRRLFKNGHFSLTQSLNHLARHYEKQGRYDLAEPFRLESIQNNINMINNYFPSLSEKEKKEYWNTMSNNFELFNNFAIERQKDNPGILCNLYDTRLYTKAILLNSANRVKSRIMSSGDSALIDNYKTWSDMKEFLVQLYNMPANELKKKNLNIDSIEQAANVLEKDISLKSEKFAQSYEKKKVSWKSIQTLLKPDEAAIEAIRFRAIMNDRFTDTANYAFLIVSDQTEDHPDIVILGNGKQLENEYYNDYRNNIKNRQKDTVTFSRFWQKLYDKIKGYKKIYFSADGIYNKLNPETLQLPDGSYLIDQQDIQQINTTKDLLMGYFQKKQETSVYNNAVLVGNPNFSLSEDKVREVSQKIRGGQQTIQPEELLATTRGTMLTKLPGTEKEIKDVEKFLRSKKWEVSAYLGDMAVKAAVKAVSSPRVLHIATHGLFQEDVRPDNKSLLGLNPEKLQQNPLLRSGLFFTGADYYIRNESTEIKSDDNGILTAYEAMNLDLDKTELVVLSACETGLGEIQNGEGVFGLRRAFQQAGARSVIMSLWTVSDQATQELMSNFYKNWVSGMTKREAFSKAQLTIRNKYSSPYYWGAFVMVGE